MTARAAVEANLPRTLVIDVVGLTRGMLGADTPRIMAIGARGVIASMQQTRPGVTLTAQATMLSGVTARDHGIVGNGWYFREQGEVWLWRQSARLLSGETPWEAARRREPRTTAAHVFWWFAMGSSADWIATPRPVYWANGRKSPDFYARPPELKSAIKERIGDFPLFRFWGPAAGIESSRWIARAGCELLANQRPGMTFVYLPHLDYVLQREGPRGANVQRAVREVDLLVGELADAAAAIGAEVIVVSEYGIEEVERGVHINRALREAGLLEVAANEAGELLDPLASRAFAVADHQVAHVYVRDPGDVERVRSLLSGLDGVGEVLDSVGKQAAGLDHSRSGELVAIAAPRRWFTYYYWQDDRRAPDFARTVEIHKKPGYDPVELFLDPGLMLGGKPAIAWRLLKSRLGLRTVMDLIPLDDTLVRGSHGRYLDDPALWPTFIASKRPASFVGDSEPVPMTSVKQLILDVHFDQT